MANRLIGQSNAAAVVCLKLLLTVFNLVFWVSGVAILALGVWMKYKLFVYMQLTTVYYDAAPYVLVAVGCSIIIVGSLGCPPSRDYRLFSTFTACF